MLKIKVVVLFFLFLCQTAESKEPGSDIQLLIAHGFIKEAKLELIAVARNPANSDSEKIQALLLLDTIASNNTEKKVVLEMLCDIDNKYLPQLKQFEADVSKEKEQEKLAQQRLRDEERAKQYLEHAKLWRKRIREWLDRIMKRSQDKENFYSDMVRRRYRFLSREFHRYVFVDEKNQVVRRRVTGRFKLVATENLQRIHAEISRRVTKYPVIEISPVSQ